MQYIRDWFRTHFDNPQTVVLATFLIGGFSIVLFMGDMLAPALAGIVIAYLLDGLVGVLTRLGMPRRLAVYIVFLLFLAFLLLIFFGLMPLLSRQITQLINQLPLMLGKGQSLLLQLPERYPQLFNEQQVVELVQGIRGELAQMGQGMLSISITSLVSVITIGVYAILMPLLVFFFMKDKDQILDWFAGYMPRRTELSKEVWSEMDRQLGNYVRGKFIEILVVWAGTYLAFVIFGLQFAMLLGVLVGLSVVVPYVGAVAVTVPVALVAYSQWGFTADFAYLMIAYLVVQGLDGNALVPLLFSEVVNLHPIAIIIAVLVFGGFWGVWGVFFAIPLATLVQAVLRAWPASEAAMGSAG